MTLCRRMVALPALCLRRSLPRPGSRAPRSSRSRPAASSLDRRLAVAGTPIQVYDMITGDLKPWWDHTFSDHPKALYVELAGRRLLPISTARATA